MCVNPTCGFTIRVAVFQDGERFPYLFDCETGLPVFDSTLFVVSQFRNASLAANTIEQALRSVMLVCILEKHLAINLSERLRSGSFLSQTELDYLTQLAGMSLRVLERVEEAPQSRKRGSTRATSRGLVPTLPVLKRGDYVSANTKSIRLHYAGVYLKWLATREIQRTEDASAAERLVTRTDEVLRALKIRTPPVRARSREAIAPEERARVLEVIGEKSPDNPWNHPFVRLRNRLIIMWGIGCGLRRGELLAMTVKLVELQFRRATIVRSPDNRRDPRRHPPSVKTRERHVPLGAELIALTQEYIRERGRIPAARKHGFLIVSKEGSPLSLSAMTKVFTDLRERSPGINQTLTMHVLRHVWNEEFSDLVDAKLITPEEETRIRNEAMGWSDRSKTGEKYQRRRTRARASDFSLEIQEKFMRETKTK